MIGSWLRRCVLAGSMIACLPACSPPAAPAGESSTQASATATALVTTVASAGPPTPRTASPTPTSLSTETWAFADSTLAPSYRELRPLTSDVYVTRGGEHMIALHNDRNYEIVSKGKSTRGADALSSPFVRLSPGEGFAVLVEERSREMANDVVVIRLSDHAVVHKAEYSADPFWVAEGVLAYRTGKRAMRFDVRTGEATPVGPAQELYCENIGPEYHRKQVCPENRFSAVRAVDADFTHWLVSDFNGFHEDRLRVVELATGKSTTIADRDTHGFPLYPTVSPRGTRFCIKPEKDGSRSLWCGRFPQVDDVRRLHEWGQEDALPSGPWIDEERLLLSSFGMLDLAKGRRVVLETGLPPFAGLAPMGERYLLASSNFVFLLDLQERTRTRLNPEVTSRSFGTTLAFVGAARSPTGRLWVIRQESERSVLPDLYELTLVPRP